MTLLQLQYFSVLARALHYTHAAEELHISQPTLSYSINELEKELGTNLFEKRGRNVSLSESGVRFLPYVQKSLALLNEGSEILKQMSDNIPMIIRLGYFHSISSSFIPSLVERVYEEKQNKEIRFQFTEGTSFDVFNKLKNGELDLIFCAHRDDWADSVTIMRQPLYLAVPISHRLAQKEFVTLDDFSQEPMVMLDKPSSLRTIMDHIFIRRRIIPNVVFEVRECNAALQYVSLNFGVSVLPEVPGMKTKRVARLPIKDPNLEFVRTVYLSWDRQRPLSPAIQRVRDLIIQEYTNTSLS
jgi:hypothetical protein